MFELAIMGKNTSSSKLQGLYAARLTLIGICDPLNQSLQNSLENFLSRALAL